MVNTTVITAKADENIHMRFKSLDDKGLLNTVVNTVVYVFATGDWLKFSSQHVIMTLQTNSVNIQYSLVSERRLYPI